MSNSNPSSKPVRIELPTRGLSRRQFIYTTALAASSLAISSYAAPRSKFKSPNEKLNVGIIGAGGKGEVDSNGLASENIVALCDVDSDTLAKAAKKWPSARLYRDYRVMLEKEKTLDAVTISTPDHQHAPAAMQAMHLGRHIYCQKPLTHTIYEARALTLAARKYKVVTQMGNQGHSGDGNRRLCEMIWSGAIGKVTEAHCWTNRPIWPQGLERPAGSDPVPKNLDWDLWIGPAPMRPFVDKWPEETNVTSTKRRGSGKVYHPFAWRGWWDFGCGALGDMGCHVMDGANWALKLGAPTSVELVDSSPITTEMAPSWAIIRYQFPARGDMPACSLTWYDGGKLPARPAEMEAEKFEESGTLLIGDKGKLMCATYGERPRLLPESSMADYKKPEPTIPRVPDNDPYKDFIRACKGGPAACSNFDVSGPFTETVLLGNLALRIGKKLEWDSAKMRVKNCKEADQYIRTKYRKGWSI
ncbi:MAG: iolG 1 [Pedosphaera sp.]|nr:iolG 1 [Pedosphaera sp.]